MIRYLLPQRAATNQTLGHPAAGIIGWNDPNTNTTGVSVTPNTALTFSAVWCAVRIISETIATLPCLLYRRKSDDSRERAVEDDRYWLISEEPHPLISSVNWFESQTAQLVLNGNTYSKIIWASGTPDRLEPRAPESVTMYVEGDRLYYEVADPKDRIYPDNMLHVAGIGGDGLSGWSVIKYAQQSIGAALAGDQYAGGQWGNGATPSGVLTHPMRLDKPAREMIRREWEDVHKGANNAGKIAIMHGGMEFKPISMSNEDAQFLESREFSIREIARWFRLPPHMLADLADSSVRANIEQQAIEFIVYSLKPWLARWEQALSRKLLSREERKDLYYEFLLESLLRGDSQAQAQAWSVGRQWGWYSVNDIRKMMNLPPVDGGDRYLQPANMVPADSDMAEGRIQPAAAPAMSRPPREEEDDDEAVPEALTDEMQRNLAASLSEIIANGQKLREELERGTRQLNESLAAADVKTQQAVAGLREQREEIRRDIQTPDRCQVQGYSTKQDHIVMACNQMLQEALRVAGRQEKADVAKAAKNAAKGKNFVAWLDNFYAAYPIKLEDRVWPAVNSFNLASGLAGEHAGQIATQLATDHHAELLQACDGSPDGFGGRIQMIMNGWDEKLADIRLGSGV